MCPKHNSMSVSVPRAREMSFANDKVGIKALVKRLEKLRPELDRAGGHRWTRTSVHARLTGAEFRSLWSTHARSETSLKSTGELAKTDSIDADVLAHFAEAVRPALRPLPDVVTLELRALTARRRQLIEMIVAEKNRLAAASKAVTKRIAAHIRWSRTGTRRRRPRPRPYHPSKPHLARKPRVSQIHPQHRPCDQSYTARRAARAR